MIRTISPCVNSALISNGIFLKSMTRGVDRSRSRARVLAIITDILMKNLQHTNGMKRIRLMSDTRVRKGREQSRSTQRHEAPSVLKITRHATLNRLTSCIVIWSDTAVSKYPRVRNSQLYSDSSNKTKGAINQIRKCTWTLSIVFSRDIRIR